MPFYYVHSATTLQKLNTSGTITTLTLPTGVSVLSSRRGRFATLNKQVVFVNAGTVNLAIDTADDTVRALVPVPPSAPPLLAASSGAGNLTGNYKARYTFAVKDSTGKIITESAMSPEPLAAVSLTSKKLNLTGIETSDDASVNTRRLYRTTAGGSVYFHWRDLDGNVQTSMEDDMSDASLGLIAAPTGLGFPPGSSAGSSRMELVTAWKGRLWGRAGGPRADLDVLLWTDPNSIYAWGNLNRLNVGKVGDDSFGITGFIPRRNELGITKRDSIHVITDSANPAPSYRTLIEGVGLIAPESVVIEDDIAYFLGEDGVYRWDSSGFTLISEKNVHPWFTTSDTFQRASFEDAIGWWDSDEKAYKLLLPATGQSTLNRWVAYYPQRDIWMGPHKTDAFTPSYAFVLEDSSELPLPCLFSTSGFVWKKQATRTDDTATAVDLDMTTQFHSANTPDVEKVWLQPSVITKIESAGTLTITPTVGGLDASAGTAISHTLTLGRERLRRLGLGRFAKLRFRENTAGQDVTLYGYELPLHEAGRR